MLRAELYQGDAWSWRQEAESNSSPGILDLLHRGLSNGGGLKKNAHLKQRKHFQSQVLLLHLLWNLVLTLILSYNSNNQTWN